MRESDAWQMEHPAPSVPTVESTPSVRLARKVHSSPQKGLTSVASTSGASTGARFRGLR